MKSVFQTDVSNKCIRAPENVKSGPGPPRGFPGDSGRLIAISIKSTTCENRTRDWTGPRSSRRTNPMGLGGRSLPGDLDQHLSRPLRPRGLEGGLGVVEREDGADQRADVDHPGGEGGD